MDYLEYDKFKMEKINDIDYFVKKYDNENENSIIKFSNEIEISKKFNNHPNFLNYYHKNTKKNYLYSKFEYEYLDLEKKIPKKISNRIKLCKKVIKIVHFLHTNKIAHRDIKPENFLYSSKNKNIKIIDFETSYIEGFTNSSNELPLFGTHGFMAPELLLENFCSKNKSLDFYINCDKYSLGCTLHYIITGEDMVYKHSNSLKTFEDNKNNNRNILKDFIPSEWYNIIMSLTDIDPLKRMNLD